MIFDTHRSIKRIIFKFSNCSSLSIGDDCESNKSEKQNMAIKFKNKIVVMIFDRSYSSLRK